MSEYYDHNIVRCKCSFCKIEHDASNAVSSIIRVASEFRSGRYG